MTQREGKAGAPQGALRGPREVPELEREKEIAASVSTCANEGRHEREMSEKIAGLLANVSKFAGLLANEH